MRLIRNGLMLITKSMNRISKQGLLNIAVVKALFDVARLLHSEIYRLSVFKANRLMHPVRQLNRTCQRWLINPKNRIKERVNPERVVPIFITKHYLEFIGN